VVAVVIVIGALVIVVALVVVIVFVVVALVVIIVDVEGEDVVFVVQDASNIATTNKKIKPNQKHLLFNFCPLFYLLSIYLCRDGNYYCPCQGIEGFETSNVRL